MIPSAEYSNFPDEILLEDELSPKPNRTYALDLQSKRILGMIDGQEAIKQAIYKILATERFAYLIYSSDYGSELRNYMHNPITYAKADLPREIVEALLVDDRMTDIDNFTVTIKDSTTLLVDFDVESTAGNIKIKSVDMKVR